MLKLIEFLDLNTCEQEPNLRFEMWDSKDTK